jgi:hypothetical protein
MQQFCQLFLGITLRPTDCEPLLFALELAGLGVRLIS